MSPSYGPLAGRYDALTGDVPYGEFLSFYEAVFTGSGRAIHTVLDLCCGTGTLSLLLAERGYELISVDASSDMLSSFQQKLGSLPEGVVSPLLLCQHAKELDLYDTVDAAVSSLDGFNYMSPEILPEVFRRLHLFMNPGAPLILDILSPEHLRSLDGQCFVDEGDGYLCLWRAGVEQNLLQYGLDLFELAKKGLWRRGQEEHFEYIHEPEQLMELLRAAGFENIRLTADGPQCGEGRLFITARR